MCVLMKIIFNLAEKATEHKLFTLISSTQIKSKSLLSIEKIFFPSFKLSFYLVRFQHFRYRGAISGEQIRTY